MQPKESKSNRHFIISLFKSLVRFLAGGAMIMANDELVVTAGIFLIVAEVLGIAEEIF